MVEKSLTGAWVVRPADEQLGDLRQSFEKFPSIEPGEEFTRYN